MSSNAAECGKTAARSGEKVGWKVPKMSKENGHQTYNVLLVDDELLIRLAVKSFLRNTEFSLTEVGNAQEALEALHKSKYDLIISDIQMSPVDGFEFRNQVRAFNREIPFIFLTSVVGSSEEDTFIRIMDDLFSYYIPKGSGTKFLLRKIRQVVYAFSVANLSKYQQHHIDMNRSVAAMVQQAMLPPWAHRGGNFDYSFLYRPLGNLSGDLVDFINVSEDEVLVVFGDVSGHGTHAALVMTALQAFLKQTVNADNAKKPHEIARLTNRFLFEHFGGVAYICAQIIYLNAKSGTLKVLNSGLPDIRLYSPATRTLSKIDTSKIGTVPLGLMSDTVFHESNVAETTFGDEYFFLFTDGLLDLHASNDMDNVDSIGLVEKSILSVMQTPNATDDFWGIPYLVYDSITERGFKVPQDDTLIMVFCKKRPLSGMNSFLKVASANYLSTDKCIQQAREHMKKCCPDKNICVYAELLLSEFLNNIVEHGTKNRAFKNDAIVFKLNCTSDDGFEIKVWDRGGKWDYCETSEIPDEKLEMLCAKNATGGRGIHIMRKLAPKILTLHKNGLNETKFNLPCFHDKKECLHNEG